MNFPDRIRGYFQPHPPIQTQSLDEFKALLCQRDNASVQLRIELEDVALSDPVQRELQYYLKLLAALRRGTKIVYRRQLGAITYTPGEQGMYGHIEAANLNSLISARNDFLGLKEDLPRLSADYFFGRDPIPQEDLGQRFFEADNRRLKGWEVQPRLRLIS